jgi:hypothetical protein
MEQNLRFLISWLLRTDLKSADLVMSTLGIRQIIDLVTALGAIKLDPESNKLTCHCSWPRRDWF